jgi:hypothetical protein
MEQYERIALNVVTIKELWSRTYNTDGKPDWSHLYPYYHPDVVFQDSVQRIDGLDDFKEMCKRLTDRSQSLRMDIKNITEGEGYIMMEWKMTMSFRKSPDTPIYGCTRISFAQDGRIIEQRDYYDLWGDIFNGIPHFSKMYRRFMHRFFG